MIANYWSPEFRQLYGGEFPRDYACIDVETSGFNRDKDVIIEWGHCMVRDCEVVDRNSFILDWSNHNVVPDYWIHDRLDHLGRKMRLEQKAWRLSYDVMKKEGIRPPEKVLKFMFNYIMTLMKNRTLIVSHNGYSFDEGMFNHNFEGFLGISDFSFGENAMFDTGAIEKASQAVDDPTYQPRVGETMRKYFQRVVHARLPGAKWNLDRHCATKYDFHGKYGLKKEDMHGAGTDAYCTHLLMEEYRSQLGPVSHFITPAMCQGELPASPESPMQDMEDFFTESLKKPPVQPAGPRRRGQRCN